MKKTMLFAAFCAFTALAPAAGDIEARVSGLLAKLTLEEKLTLTSGLDGFATRPIPRLGIPSVHMTDGPNGVRWGENATAFPTGIALAATWDQALVAEAGSLMAMEARGRGREVLLGPCINIARHPFGGRGFEGYGEDPYLTGRLAVAWINGLQAQGVGASLKHFAANNQETRRTSIDTIVEERVLREIYLPAFEAAVKEAKPATVMAAYNKLNGYHCSANSWLLNKVLKDEWGYQGVVVSDWGATHEGAGALEAGQDLEMPGPGDFMGPKLLADAKAGKLDPASIDKAASRMLRLIVSLGLMDGKAATENKRAVNTPAAQAVARRAATEGAVLLKNEGALLPFTKSKVKRLAIIGPSAASARVGGGGSSEVKPPYAIAPLQGLKEAYGKDVEIIYAEGASLGDDLKPVPASAWKELKAEYWDNAKLAGEPKLRRLEKALDYDWRQNAPDGSLPKDGFSAHWRGTLIAPGSGRYRQGLRGDDGYRLKVDGKPLLEDWSDHAAQTKAADIDFEAGKAYSVEVEFYENGGDASLQLGWLPPQDLLADAVAAAKKADAAIVFTGSSAQFESEGFDRSQFGLPPKQDELILAILAANPRTAVVLLTGSPVDMEAWVEKVPAVLQAWFPGLEGGNALADLISGKANPSGKLPLSFPKKLDDVPSNKNFPGSETTVRYSEGLMVGYRHFDTANIEPRFPFGHGLSYTHFTYSDLKAVSTPKGATLSFTLANEGALPGAEVPQVYIRPLKNKVVRPLQELKAFDRVLLKPGEKRLITLPLDDRAFSYWHPTQKAWTIDKGSYEIRVGASSRDVRLKAVVSK